VELIKFRQTVCRPCIDLDNYLKFELGVSEDTTYILDSGDEKAIEKAIEFGVMSSPVMILLDDNGKEIDRVIGTNREDVNRILKKRGLIK
jgi:thioredoxin 1